MKCAVPDPESNEFVDTGEGLRPAIWVGLVIVIALTMVLAFAIK